MYVDVDVASSSALSAAGRMKYPTRSPGAIVFEKDEA